MMLADYVIPRKKPIKQREITQINHIRNQCYYKYVIAKTSRGCKGSSVRINSFAGNRTWFIFTCRQLLDQYATVPLVFGAVNLLHLKQFLYHRRCMKLVDKDTPGAPNENIVQNHLNTAVLNVFYYLNGR